MNDIFKLYYYEVIKNKNKFLIVISMNILLLGLMLLEILKSSEYGLSTIDTINAINQFKSVVDSNNELFDYINYYSLGYINIEYTYFSEFDPYIVITSIITVFLSFDIVLRGYRKKHKSFYIESVLPTSIFKMKLAKILCGFSLFLVYYLINIVLITTVIKTMHYIYPMYINDIYFDSEFIMLLPVKLTSVTSYIFGFVLISIILLQSVTSLVFCNEKISKIVNTIILTVITIIVSISMSAFFGIYFIADLGIYPQTIKILIAITIISIVLLSIDVYITKKRMRGGI